ncbi:MAG: SDR family oxidoreductase [Phycisphaeraceae bacterium]
MTDVARRGLFDLTGKTALVTGSTRGLGLAMARGLAEHGARVVINGRGVETVEATAEGLRGEGFEVGTLVCDVTDEVAVEEAIGVLERETPVDVLVNNVGIHDRAPLAEMTAAQWRGVIEVNLTSAFLVSRFVAPGMIRRGAGKIVNTCSLMSEVGRPTTGNYAAAKGGLKMLTRAMAVEWAGRNVQVNGIGPGYFETELTAGLVADPEFNAWICKRTPAGRWGRPEELVGAAVFLASGASDYVSGQVIYVDGGLLAGV